MIKQFKVLVDHWRNNVLIAKDEIISVDERLTKYDVIAKRLAEHVVEAVEKVVDKAEAVKDAVTGAKAPDAAPEAPKQP